VALLRRRIPHGESLPEQPLAAVNQEHALPDQPLADGDDLALLPPLAGG
jgi:molybdopterin converting factor small subunit